MKIITGLILFFFLIITATAQRKTIDSLKSILPQDKTDTGKINKLIYIGDQYWRIKNDSALIFFRDAMQWSEKIGFNTGEIRSRSSMANYMFNLKSDHGTALELFLFNVDLEKKTGDTNYIFWDLRSIGFIYQVMENHAKQYEYITRLRDLVNSGIFRDSVRLSTYRIVMENRLADIYERLNKLDSSKYYRFKVYRFGRMNNDNLRTATGSQGLGSLYKQEKKYDSAFYYYRISLDASRKRPDVFRNTLLGIGKLFLDLNQMDSAFYYINTAFGLSKNSGNNPLQMIESAELLATIYYSRRQADSAYSYLSLSKLLRDSIFTSEKLIQVQNLTLQQGLQKQKQEQMKKEAVMEYKSRIKVYALSAGLAGLLIFIFILYRNNRQRQIANKKVEKAYMDLKSTQAQLIQSEKMASLGELTAGIAHEIQNPLNFVNNFSDVNTELIDELKSELATGNVQLANEIADDIKDNEQKINHHGKRADAIVKGMLQHSRTSSGQKELTDINALADEYLRLAYHGLRAKDKSFNATMKTDFDESIGNINIIPQDIGRVILNLINNAFYAVDEKKKQTGDGYEPTVSVSTKKNNGKVEIKVSDNGNGIPQKVLDKIFQPFFTTKPTGQGTGLGLSLSYDIVRAHGGEIKVETKEGEGSTFIIQLPTNE